MFKDTCQVTGKVIRGYTIDEFNENWNKHIESLKVKEEPKKEEPKKETKKKLEVKAKIDKVKEIKKKVIKKKK
jgi:hypothetical protein